LSDKNKLFGGKYSLHVYCQVEGKGAGNGWNAIGAILVTCSPFLTEQVVVALML